MEQFMENITQFAIRNSILGVIMFIFSYIAIASYDYASKRQSHLIRSMYLRSALRQDVGWYDTNQTGDFASKMAEYYYITPTTLVMFDNRNVAKLEEGLGEKVAMFIHFIVAFLACITLAFVKGWELALICLVSLPVTLISVGIVARVTSSLSRKELDAYAKAGSIAEEVLGSIRTVVAFGGQDKEATRYAKNLVFARDNNIKRGFFTGVGFGLLWFFIYASYALAFWYGVGLILEERDLPPDQIHYTVSVMTTVFFSVMMGSMNLGMTSPFIEAFGIATGAAGSVYAVIERVPPIDSSSEEGERPEKVAGDISFRGVRFNYPSRPDVDVLQGLDLEIRHGETVALVGSSGCGKSTCVQLIQRFYDPLEGEVKLDGKNIRDLNLTWLRSHIGVVGQEPVLFGATIAENIRFGNENASIDDIQMAAREANAHDFIMKLPQGYDTMVGERGAQLSGGQKQRVAIARALVRKPAILLLDEATSALDTSSEAKVQHALDKASQGRTTVIVAHRLTTIRGANKIAVLSGGVVVEQGTHNELMAIKGHYHELVTAQVRDDPEAIHDGEEAQGGRGRLISESSEDASTGFSRSLSKMSGRSGDSMRSSIRSNTEVALLEQEDDTIDVPLTKILATNKPEWPYILAGCICSIIVGFSMPLFAVIFGNILGVLSECDEEVVRDKTNMFCLYFVIVGVIIGFSTFIQMYTFGIAGERLTLRLRDLSFSTMLNQEIAYFDRESNSVGSLCTRLSGDAAAVQGVSCVYSSTNNLILAAEMFQATGMRIGIVLQSISTIALAIALSMWYEWRLGLVALSFTPLIIVSMFLMSRMMRQGKDRNKDGNTGLEAATKLLHATLLFLQSRRVSQESPEAAKSNIRTVAGLCRERGIHDEYMRELAVPFRDAKNYSHLRGLVYGIARSLMFFAYAACMYYGGTLVRDEGMPYEDVFKVAQALIMGTVSVANALAFAPNFSKGLEAAGKIFILLERKIKIYDTTASLDKDWKAVGNVEYDKVQFFYPNRPAAPVLRGLDLLIRPGQTVALVGHSGCGKSTCVQLLERFYDPAAGTVSLDKRDVSAMPLAQLRSQLGIVSQEPVLFDRTIAENIMYGDNDRDVSMSEVIEAAQKANIHSFISSLPLGYDTRLGERGTQLSGGQKQRVAIARALVRNPRVLLLDEATSALDTESEKV
ncbi:hypothetical protein B566_EDAN011836 [Ephemera danica]|nr:hypothetical protein B566_EDAN011836 [Ephemera danica]